MKNCVDKHLLLRVNKNMQIATLAQSVEQGTENPRVAGSIPAGGTTKPLTLCKGFFIYSRIDNFLYLSIRSRYDYFVLLCRSVYTPSQNNLGA
jgi:hypothetical protein